MIIAITSTGLNSDALISEKFGRCSYFALYDTETKTIHTIPNTAENLEHGAGPKAAQLIINENTEVVLTGAVGGNAEDVLNKGRIKIITGLKSNMKVSEAVDYYLNNN